MARLWDEVTTGFLSGRSALPPPLDEWRRAYNGSGSGRVDDQALAEPYLGPLLSAWVPAVFLALNPGATYPDFQYRHGVFAEEIRELGSYHAWAAGWPYLRHPWLRENGASRWSRARLAFARRWFDDPGLSTFETVSFELFPWHSARLTGRIAVDPEIIRRLVWEPIGEMGQPTVFAFGAPWFELLPRLGVEVVEVLGRGGRPYPTSVPSRSVLVARTAAGSLLVAERHEGSATPPSASEAAALRSAVMELTG